MGVQGAREPRVVGLPLVVVPAWTLGKKLEHWAKLLPLWPRRVSSWIKGCLFGGALSCPVPNSTPRWWRSGGWERQAIKSSFPQVC